MKKLLVLLAVLFFAFISYGQNPATFASGIRLPNSTEETGFARIPVQDVNGNITGYINKSDLELALGVPPVDGYVLSSTIAGIRSWIANGTGGGTNDYNLLLNKPFNDVNGEWTSTAGLIIPDPFNININGGGLNVSGPTIVTNFTATGLSTFRNPRINGVTTPTFEFEYDDGSNQQIGLLFVDPADGNLKYRPTQTGTIFDLINGSSGINWSTPIDANITFSGDQLWNIGSPTNQALGIYAATFHGSLEGGAINATTANFSQYLQLFDEADLTPGGWAVDRAPIWWNATDDRIKLIKNNATIEQLAYLSDLSALPGDNLGNHTATQDILPDIDNTRSLGSESNTWLRSYAYRFATKMTDGEYAMFASNGSGDLNMGYNASSTGVYTAEYRFRQGGPLNTVDIVTVDFMNAQGYSTGSTTLPYTSIGGSGSNVTTGAAFEDVTNIMTGNGSITVNLASDATYDHPNGTILTFQTNAEQSWTFQLDSGALGIVPFTTTGGPKFSFIKSADNTWVLSDVFRPYSDRTLNLSDGATISFAEISNHINGNIFISQGLTDTRTYTVDNIPNWTIKLFADVDTETGVSIFKEGSGMSFFGVDKDGDFKGSNNAVSITGYGDANAFEKSDGNLKWSGNFDWITTDVTAPLVLSASVEDLDPDALVVVFNENVTFTNTTGLSLDSSWTGVSFSSIQSGNGTSTVTFDLDTNIANGETGNFVYSASNTGVDDSSNALAAGSTSVTNNVGSSGLYSDANAANANPETTGSTIGFTATLNTTIDGVDNVLFTNGTESVDIGVSTSENSQVRFNGSGILNGDQIQVQFDVYVEGDGSGNVFARLNDAQGWDVEQQTNIGSASRDEWVSVDMTATATQNNPEIQIQASGSATGITGYKVDNIRFTKLN